MNRNLGKTVRVSVVAAVFAAGLAACPETEQGRPVVESTPDNFCGEVAKVACYNMFRCCTGAQIEGLLGLTQSITEQDCRRDVKLLCLDDTANIRDSMSKGRARLNAGALNLCLEAMLAPEGVCFQHRPDIPWSDICDQPAVSGLVAPGQNCLYDYECFENSYCAPDRTCRAFPQINEPCPGSVCAEGLYCDWSQVTCQPRKGANQPCDMSMECSEQLYCHVSATGGTCQAKKQVGVQCGGDYECDSDYCIPGLCDDNSACYGDDDCTGTCQGSQDTCWTDGDCPGTCSGSADACYYDYDCTSNLCIHEQCLGVCHGMPVCGDYYTVVDYCPSSVGWIF